MFLDYKNNLKNFILIAIAITLLRLVFLYYSKFPLWVDESQYWFWSKFLDAGYYSKPPAIAWIINFTTEYFGDKEFFIRLASPLIHLFTAIYIYLIADKLYDEKISFYAGLLYLLMPATSLSSNFISADAPLALCWAGAVFHLITAMEFKDESRFFSWLLFSIWLGLGFLSKYTIIILLGGLTIYVLFARFSHFFSANFIFSLVFAGFIFLPNILWNYNNDFVSFSHTQENLLNSKNPKNFIEQFNSLNFKGFAEFLLAQFAVFGFLIIFIFSALYRRVKTDILLIAEEKDARLLLFWISLPTLIAGLLLSLIASAQAHWSAPAYIGLSILITWYLVRKNKEFYLKLWLAIAFTLFLVLSVISTKPTLITNLNLKKNPLERLYIWYEPANKIKEYQELYPSALIASDERKIIAPLTYALRNGKNPQIIYKLKLSGGVNDHFDLKYKLPNDAKEIIFITRSLTEENLKKYNYKVNLLASKDIFRIYFLTK